MLAAAEVSNIKDLAQQFAEAQYKMMRDAMRGGKSTKEAKDALAYVVEQLTFAIIQGSQRRS